MSKILQMLNEDKYAGDFTWTPLVEWTTDNGEMGVYQTEVRHDYGSPSIWVMGIILTNDGDKFLKSAGENTRDITVSDFEAIAKFAGAKRV